MKKRCETCAHFREYYHMDTIYSNEYICKLHGKSALITHPATQYCEKHISDLGHKRKEKLKKLLD